MRLNFAFFAGATSRRTSSQSLHDLYPLTPWQAIAKVSVSAKSLATSHKRRHLLRGKCHHISG